MPVGRNLFFTCKAQVQNPELVRDLRWLGPEGKRIPEDDRIYTEEQPGDAAIMLFMKNLRERDSGTYTCEGVYANNEKMVTQVSITTFIGITWDDASRSQNGVLDEDFKIRCVVRASPPATIDWLKESLIISTGDRYVIETDGLLIKKVNREDAGTYTCRARVLETGSLEERDIKMEVHVPPVWIEKPSFSVRGVEQEKVELGCIADGTPHPHYTWVDWEGRSATDKEGWSVVKDTGHLTAFFLKREDAGRYTCIAENPAGRIESSTELEVIIKPKVQELLNKTMAVGVPEGRLVCKASGDPTPDIIWRKWSRNEPYILGGQPTDDRIYVESRIERAPDYTEDRIEEWRVSEIIISAVERQDDGLYECKAHNEGGQFFKSGHVQVEFAPTFEEQPMYDEWSWDQNPINLTCIATAIPNATLTWWYEDREIGREIIDRNYEVIGRGPRSDLTITPLDRQYFGVYTCKAENPHGEAFQEIELHEAREPSYVQQAVTDKVTATTIQFRFVAPTDTGGLPIDSYTCQYKEVSLEWSDGAKRVWPVSQNNVYILEMLQPTTTYDFRFAARNLVGMSEWGASQQITMPQRGPPEAPRINTLGYHVINDLINITSPTRFDLSWYLPEDNGEPIDFFEVSMFPVEFVGTGSFTHDRIRGSDSGPEPTPPGVGGNVGPGLAAGQSTHTAATSGSWRRVGNVFRTEVPHPGNVRYELRDLYPDTYHMVEIRAHNSLGYSAVSSNVILTAKDTENSGIIPTPNTREGTNMANDISISISSSSSIAILPITLYINSKSIFHKL